LPHEDRHNSTVNSLCGLQIDGGLRVTALTCPALAAAVLVMLGAAGCGSSASSTTSAPPTATLTKVEFLAKGNAICKLANRKQNAAAQKEYGIKQPTTAQIISFATDTAIPGISDQIKALRALVDPSPTVKKMLNIAEQDLEKVKSNPTLLASESDPFANFRRLAHLYGLTACAPSSSPAIK
jgi:hypothetical protein